MYKASVNRNGALSLALFLLVSSLCTRQAVAQTNGILREVWFGINGNAVPDLTNNPAFPDSPSLDGVLTDYFETPSAKSGGLMSGLMAAFHRQPGIRNPPPSIVANP